MIFLLRLVLVELQQQLQSREWSSQIVWRGVMEGGIGEDTYMKCICVLGRMSWCLCSGKSCQEESDEESRLGLVGCFVNRPQHEMRDAKRGARAWPAVNGPKGQRRQVRYRNSNLIRRLIGDITATRRTPPLFTTVFLQFPYRALAEQSLFSFSSDDLEKLLIPQKKIDTKPFLLSTPSVSSSP